MKKLLAIKFKKDLVKKSSVIAFALSVVIGISYFGYRSATENLYGGGSDCSKCGSEQPCQTDCNTCVEYTNFCVRNGVSGLGGTANSWTHSSSSCKHYDSQGRHDIRLDNVVHGDWPKPHGHDMNWNLSCDYKDPCAFYNSYTHRLCTEQEKADHADCWD